MWIPVFPGESIFQDSSRLHIFPSLHWSLCSVRVNCYSIDIMLLSITGQGILTSMRVTDFSHFFLLADVDIPWETGDLHSLQSAFVRLLSDTVYCLLICYCALNKFRIEAYAKLWQTDQFTLKTKVSSQTEQSRQGKSVSGFQILIHFSKHWVRLKTANIYFWTWPIIWMANIWIFYSVVIIVVIIITENQPEAHG